MTFPPAASLHEPTTSFYSRWQALNDWLAGYAEFWRPAPFMEPAPAWAQACPELSSWLEALTDEDCDYYEQHLIEFAGRIRGWLPGLVDYEQRIAVPVLSPSPATLAETTLPEVAATDMPGRKRAQAGAFAASVIPLNRPVLDWCCGKGHLSRTLARQCPEPVQGFEWDSALVDDGNRLARQFADAVTLHCQDVMVDDMSWPADSHGVALHACGDLHRQLIRRGSADGAPRLSLSPCCYHLSADADYQPLSVQANEHPKALRLSRNELRLAVQETVTAPARVRAQTAVVSQWRLGFDALQRHLRGCDEYLPVPSHPPRLVNEGVEAFCRWAADKKQLPLPARVDWDHWLDAGRQRFRQVRRHELLRHLFRRPLELWLVLDYAVFLVEQGYRVRLGTFCDRSMTPRNLLLDAVRACDTPPSPRSHP